jgi:hypothetical protein
MGEERGDGVGLDAGCGLGAGCLEGGVDDAPVLHVRGEEAERPLGGLCPGDGVLWAEGVVVESDEQVSLLVDASVNRNAV